MRSLYDKKKLLEVVAQGILYSLVTITKFIFCFLKLLGFLEQSHKRLQYFLYLGAGRRFEKSYCCSAVLLPVLLVALLLLLSVGPLVGFWINYKLPTRKYLAIASDFIDCEDVTHSIQYSLYDNVSITENMDRRDNPDLEIDGYKIARSKLKYHASNFSFSSNWSNDTCSIKTYVPDDYIERPLYMRKNSTITFDLFLKCENFDQASLYLFDDLNKADTFSRNKEAVPEYSLKENLVLGSNRKVFTINKSSYYYVVCEVRCSGKIHYEDNATFQVVYIDNDDYSAANIFRIGQDGMSNNVRVNRNELILCFIRPVSPNTFDFPSTHLTISYTFKPSAIAATILVPLAIIVLVTALCVCTCINKKFQRAQRLRKFFRNQTRPYERVSSRDV